MSQSKYRSIIHYVLITSAALTLAGCRDCTLGGGNSNNSTSRTQAAFLLEYNNTYDQPGDDTGGARSRSIFL